MSHDHEAPAPQGALDRLAAGAAWLMAAAAVLCVVAMMAVVTLEVISRYVFNAPSTWSDEIASYLLIAIVFLGLAEDLRLGIHIRIDVLLMRLSVPVRRWFERFAYVVGVVFSVLLLFAVWTRFRNFWVRGTISDSLLMTPQWIPMAPVLLASVVFVFVMLVGLLRVLRS